MLATLYLAVAGSGIGGLALTRLIPARLTVRGDELIFERLPIRRRELRERAEAIVVEAASQAEATTLADFYAKSLAPFFAGPRHYWAHVTQSRRPLRLLTSELQALQRFLGEREKALAQELTALVEQKDAADHAQALQATLKVWLAAHVAVTGALLAFTLVHVIVVYAYGAA